MKNLKAKLRRDGGFTLVEMLIVVAIIAILIAISIPVIGGAMEGARDATDQANERAAKAEALIVYLGGGTIQKGDSGSEITVKPGEAFGDATTTVYYDAVSGALTQAKPTGYGKCTASNGTHYTGMTNSTGTHSGYVLTVAVNGDGVVTLTWVKP